MAGIKPPELEKLVGVETYLSETEGIGGKIKQVPEDFVVEEIFPDVEEDENGEYVHFTLEKNNWDTMRAVKELSKRLRVSKKRFGFAGTKDRRAVTRQRISVWKVPVGDLEKVRMKDIALSDFLRSAERINLGDAWGNRFSIAVRNIDLEDGEVEARAGRAASELSGGFPNFFGLQRFGIQRPITHQVGKAILKKDFRGAVMIYLAKVYDTETDEAVSARKSLNDNGNFREAIKIFPKYLGYENSMLNHLVNHETDFIGALRVLPKKLRWMFVHAYQSYVFNRALSFYISEKDVPESLPLIGHQSEPDEASAGVLEEDGISLEDFRTPAMPELSSKGELRSCMTGVEGLTVSGARDDELNEGKKKVNVEFKLQKGSYATTLLREFMKNEWW